MEPSPDENSALLIGIGDVSIQARRDFVDDKGTRRGRLLSIDLLRGVIVIVMAWDHVKDFLASDEGHDGGAEKTGPIFGTHSERWYGPIELWRGRPEYLFARFVSHFCAPGFAFLMGCGMVLLSISRRGKMKWTSGHLLYFFTLRGIVLIALGFVVRGATEVLLIDPSPRLRLSFGHHAAAKAIVNFFQVMTSLGMQMIVVGFILEALHVLEQFFGLSKFRFRLWARNNLFSFSFVPTCLFILGCLCIMCTHMTVHYAQHGDPASVNPRAARSFSQLVHRFVLLPGPFDHPYITMAYPLVPWLGLSLWGAAAGFEFKRDPDLAHQRALLNGILLLVAFPLIRFFGGSYLNLRGWPLHEGREHEWNSWWTVCKYPPGLPYICITMGANLVGLFLLSTINSSAKIPNIILHYGRSPLAFYVTHFWLISLCSVIVTAAQGHFGVPLPACIPFYMAIIGVEYFVVTAYDKFKSQTDVNSLWRLL